MKDGPHTQQRLDSWKSIANHMDKSCRTLQRWHTTYGLPIYRIGGSMGSIFAYGNELDEWMRTRGSRLEPEPPQIPAPERSKQSHAQDDSDYAPAVYNVPMIPESSRRRSAELVALGYRMWKTLSHGNLNTIARLFREAIDLDPNNASAFAGLGNVLVAQSALGIVDANFAYRAAQFSLQRALEIDPNNVEAKCTSAWLKMFWTREWQQAREGLDEVVEMDPPVLRGIVGQGMFRIAEGRLKEASSFLRQASKVSVLNSIALGMYCWSEYIAGEYATALFEIEQCRASGHFGLIFDVVEALAAIQGEPTEVHIRRIEALAADSPHYQVLQGVLGYAYAVSGQIQKASSLLDELINPRIVRKHADPYAVALILTGLNDNEGAVQLIEQSYREGSLWSLGFLSDPILSSLRNDRKCQPAFKRLSYPVPKSSNSELEIAEFNA